MAKKALSTNKITVVDKLANTVATTLAQVSSDVAFSTWPEPVFNPIEGELYLADYYLPRFYRGVIELEGRGFAMAQIAKILKAPSRIAQIVWPLCSMQNPGLTKEEKIDLSYWIVKLISEFREDPFCKDGKNIIWSAEKTKGVLKNSKLVVLGESKEPDIFRNSISKLNGLTWLYCELLYSSIHGMGHEFHGPYSLPNNEILIVREYYDLRPEFWTFTLKLPFDRITVLAIYKKMDIGFDFFNRTRALEPLLPFLQKVSVVINGKRNLSGADEIQNIISQLEKVSKVGVEEIGKLDKTALLEKFVESYFFILKPLQEILGKSWWPPKELYEEIEKESRKEIVERVLAGFEEMEGKSQEQFIEIISRLFNPRLK